MFKLSQTSPQLCRAMVGPRCINPNIRKAHRLVLKMTPEFLGICANLGFWPRSHMVSWCLMMSQLPRFALQRLATQGSNLNKMPAICSVNAASEMRRSAKHSSSSSSMSYDIGCRMTHMMSYEYVSAPGMCQTNQGHCCFFFEDVLTRTRT